MHSVRESERACIRLPTRQGATGYHDHRPLMEQQTAEFEAPQTAVKETFYHFFVHLQTAQLGRCHPIRTGGLPRMDTIQRDISRCLEDFRNRQSRKPIGSCAQKIVAQARRVLSVE